MSEESQNTESQNTESQDTEFENIEHEKSELEKTESQNSESEHTESQNTETQKAQANPFAKQIIEGLLLAAGKPLPINKIADVFPEDQRPNTEELKAAIKSIEEDCETRGFELKQVASGYRFQVKKEFGEWVGKLWDEKPQRYSRALLETISIIAYRQPITRGEIEKIRGVAVSTNIIRTLIERDWVRVVGHRDVPGRPAMYATTKQFLDYFNLSSLEELPPLSEIRDMEDLDPELSLEEDAPESRVLEFPSSADLEEDVHVPDEDEELAAAIGTRPIEEILGIKEEEEGEQAELDDWDDESDLVVDEEQDRAAEDSQESSSDDIDQESVSARANESSDESSDENTDKNTNESDESVDLEDQDNPEDAIDEPGDATDPDSDDDENNSPAG